MELKKVQKTMPLKLNLQMFAEGGEEATKETGADNNAQQENANKETTKAEEKKYSDKEVNDISTKNVSKALAKQLKDLGIEDVEKAKSILAKAREEEEANKSVDEKTQELTSKLNKAISDTINSKIENALLRKGVSEEKTIRAVRLIDKANIVDEGGKLDVSKLATEVEQVLKEFPELISKTEDENVGFKIGGDGKEDKKTNSLESIEKAMGIKK
ncbi:MAG: hypothetical protein J6J11_01700 [Treponema sp.]|nr:hypothetical protein [Clostridia bacterium]MBP3607018.1 hypothetical protein [Treponema sp.]